MSVSTRRACRYCLPLAAALAGVLLSPIDRHARSADGGKTLQEGKWVLPDGAPTYDIMANGKVDWYTYSGFRRYHSECHVCHGPEGEGSTYAPGLVDSLKTMSYPDFLAVVAGGRTIVRADKESVMPALGENVNVMCYIDDIYVYLKARADGALPRGKRPERGVEKSDTAKNDEGVCLGRQ